MAIIPLSRLQGVMKRFAEIEAHMSAGPDYDQIATLSREHARLKPVADAAKALIAMRDDLAEAESLVKGTDAEMALLAQEEINRLHTRIPAAEQAIQYLLLPADRDDDAGIMIEIRAGTGGNEAAIFAGDLFRMYTHYANRQGWTMELQSASVGEAGGYKEIIANIGGSGVFGRLKRESGIHRVQRVPATEARGRVHTSAASVVVLPAPENITINVRAEDIRIDTMRASGAGGQHVNTTDSAVRITHLPTGIVATSSEKSQHVNRDKAMQQLKIRLYEKERREHDSARAEARALQVGSGDRSEKIRTYNYPENRITDHRIGLTLHALDKVMAGDRLDEIVTALLREDQARQLAAMDDDV